MSDLFGLNVPVHKTGNLRDLSDQLDPTLAPFVLKSTGTAHKSEQGGVALSLQSARDILNAGAAMTGDEFVLEEMITGKVAELLIGVVKDPAHGFVITLAAGGVFTELLEDRASCLIPASRAQVEQSLMQLKMAPILTGYRNQPAANLEQILDAIEAIQAYVLANLDTVEEVEVNPLIVTPTRAVAADALIRKRHD